MPIVEATFTATATQSDLAQRIEQAMAQAVADCYAQGITDPAVINAAILAARDAVLAAG